MYQEKQAADAYKRQSLVMLDEAIGDDEKLQDALGQVEELTKCMEEEKQRHRNEVRKRGREGGTPTKDSLVMLDEAIGDDEKLQDALG